MGSLLSELVAGPPPGAGGRGGMSLLRGFMDSAGDFEGGSWSSVPVSRALQVTTAYACLRLLAGLGSSLPLKVVKRDDRRRREVRDAAYAHVWGRPNPSMSQPAFWAAQILALQAYGNAFMWKGREGASSPREPWRGVSELWPLHPELVRGGMLPDSSKMFVLGRDTEHPHGIENIGHTSLMALDGMFGLSPIRQNASALGLAIATEKFGGQFFSRGQILSGILTTDQELEDHEVEELQDRWMARHSGSSNTLKPAVLSKGAKYQAISVPPEDAQYLQTRGYQREEVVQIFGVPPHMIGLVSKSTSWGTGIEQQFIGFVVTVMVPMLVLFERMVSDELLPPELEVKFSLQALLRGDMNARANFYRTLRMMGAMSADTILELEDLPPRGLPDDYLSPSNMVRLVVPGTAETPAVEQDDVSFAGTPAPVFRALAEARCPAPGCGAVLGKNVMGAALWCKKCRAERVFGPYLATPAVAATREGEDLPRDRQDLTEAFARVIAERMIA